MQRALVERAIDGDAEAFSSLVGTSASQQYAIASLILRDRDRAQDAVQEALIAAWRNIGALRTPDAWDAWLRRLTVHACYSVARRDARRKKVELKATLDPELQASDDPSRALVERDRVERELERLGIEQRAVIVLVYYIGHSLGEAAEILDVPIGTAKSRLHRALETLRRSMDVTPTPTPDVAHAGRLT
jgi:RNA polymerase sigma factor (sigma-70 family)